MRAHLGQHFLKNAAILEKIVTILALRRDDVVIEIGSGHGELTIPLAKKISDAGGGQIIAIEKDHALAALLESLRAEGTLRAVTVREGNALTLLPEIIAQAKLKTYKLAGNLPYYITGHLLRVVSELNRKPERCVFMIQKEVAERIIARPPKMNRLAASVQFWAEPQIVDVVPKRNFSPPPAVDAAIILLKTRALAPDMGRERYYTAVRALFAHPRKTILNNLSACAKRAQRRRVQEEMGGKNEILLALQKISLRPGDRPQNLTVEHIAAIAEALF